MQIRCWWNDWKLKKSFISIGSSNWCKYTTFNKWKCINFSCWPGFVSGTNHGLDESFILSCSTSSHLERSVWITFSHHYGENEINASIKFSGTFPMCLFCRTLMKNMPPILAASADSRKPTLMTYLCVAWCVYHVFPPVLLEAQQWVCVCVSA